MVKIALYFAIVLDLLLLVSCEDVPSTDYIPEYYVEAFLIVDEPIDMIRIERTQSLSDTFKLSNALVSDAIVKILVDDKELLLKYRDTGDVDRRGYFFFDTSYKVEPNKLYRLEIQTADGKRITGETQTPERIEWETIPPDSLNFPNDTINFKDITPFKIRWKPVKNILYYLVSVKCLDTLEYGKYLSPATEEKNQKVYNPNPNEDPDVTNWDAVPNIEYPLFWLIFKWYGKQRIFVYAPDFNFLRWVFQHFRGSQINTLLTSVDGGIGVFGSASRVSANLFLKKPKKQAK